MSLSLLEVDQKSVEMALSAPENMLLLKALESFSVRLKRYGYDVLPYTPASLARLSQVPAQKKTQIRLFFEAWYSWIEPEANSPDVIPVDIEQERLFLKRALSHYGAWIHDDFWKTIEHGQLIELYGSDMIQLYRNLRFFDFCSYSLLDVSVFEWYYLWDRPKTVLNEMFRYAENVKNVPTPVMEYKVPEHVLRETRSNAEDDGGQMASLVKFKNIGSVFQGVDPMPFGGIATSVAEVIAVGAEAQQIQFV